MSESALEAKLMLHIRAHKLPTPEREYRFHPVRKWRFDAAWPEHKVAVEVEGGIYTRGRHTRPAGFNEDSRKYAQATLLGWRVFRVTEAHIDSGEAVQWVAAALGMKWEGARGWQMGVA